MHYSGKIENVILYYFVANIFRTICIKFYQNWPGFVDDVTKHFGAFSGSRFQLPFTRGWFTEAEGRWPPSPSPKFLLKSEETTCITQRRVQGWAWGRNANAKFHKVV